MRVSIITALLAESLLISVLAVALPLFVTTLTVARYLFSGEQTSLIFIDVFMIYEDFESSDFREPEFQRLNRVASCDLTLRLNGRSTTE